MATAAVYLSESRRTRHFVGQRYVAKLPNSKIFALLLVCIPA